LIAKIVNSTSPSNSKNFEYDKLGRLTKDSVVGSESTRYSTYAYDENGNRTQTGGKSPGVMLPPIPYTTDAASNRLMAVKSSTFSYDGAGNTTVSPMRSGSTYGYDGFNRLNKVVTEGKTTSYVINALGQRIRKTQGTLATQWGYVYGVSGQLEAEYYWGNGSWTHYLRLPGGEPIAMVRGGQLYMVHTDHLGRPELVTNNAKAFVWRSSNKEFDRVVTLDSIGGLNLGFPGQYFDIETSLWYNNFRTYDPSTGRYIESDPIGLSGGINTYTYAEWNPQMFTYPFGLDKSIFERVSGTPEMIAAQNRLQELANTAARNVDNTCGFRCSFPWIRGTLIHSEFKRLVDSS